MPVQEMIARGYTVSVRSPTDAADGYHIVYTPRGTQRGWGDGFFTPSGPGAYRSSTYSSRSRRSVERRRSRCPLGECSETRSDAGRIRPGRSEPGNEPVPLSMAKMNHVRFGGDSGVRWPNHGLPRLGEQLGKKVRVGAIIEVQIQGHGLCPPPGKADTSRWRGPERSPRDWPRNTPEPRGSPPPASRNSPPSAHR